MSRFANLIPVLALFFLARVNVAQEINISGKVTNAMGTAISGAAVNLTNAGISTTTGPDGLFSLVGQVPIAIEENRSLPHSLSATIQKGFLRIGVPEKSEVIVTAHSLEGAVLSKARHQLNAGIHDLGVTSGKAGLVFIRVSSGKGNAVLKAFRVEGATRGLVTPVRGDSPPAMAKMAAGAAINDVLTVTAAGYTKYSMPVTEALMSGITVIMEKSGEGGLLAHWKFDEPGESDISVDASGNGWDGTPGKPIRRGEGKFGPHSLSLRCPQVMLLKKEMPVPTWPLSFSAWVRMRTATGRNYILTYLPNTVESHHEYELVFFVEGGKVIRNFFYGHAVAGGTKEKWGLVSPNNVQVNEWIHIAVTIGEPSGGTPEVVSAQVGTTPTTMKLYENGVVTDSGIFNFPVFGRAGEWAIGAKPQGEYCMEGDIDEMMIFNKQLTDEEVKKLYTTNGL